MTLSKIWSEMFFPRSDMMCTVMSIKQYIVRCFCDVVIRKWKIENHAILEQNEMIFFFLLLILSLKQTNMKCLHLSREKNPNMAMDRNQQNITINAHVKHWSWYNIGYTKWMYIIILQSSAVDEKSFTPKLDDFLICVFYVQVVIYGWPSCHLRRGTVFPARTDIMCNSGFPFCSDWLQ